MNEVKREIFRYIRGVQKKKAIILCALPLAVYMALRCNKGGIGFRFERFISRGIGLWLNRIIFPVIFLIFLAAVFFIVYNLKELVRLKRRLSEMSAEETKLLEDDFRFGLVYLDRGIIIGRRFIIAGGSMRLFALEEISGVYNDIRETQSVFRMVLSGANDVVKTKIIKAEYHNKSFIHDRRICAVEVHKTYSSSEGTMNGYEQLERIETLIKSKIDELAGKKAW